MMYRGQLAEAEQHHQRAYQLNPFDAHVMALRAPLAVYLGKPDDGERWARRAMQLNPDHPDWYVTNLGLALYGLLAAGLAVHVPSWILLTMTIPAIAMSAFLGRSLIVNGHQCRICWLGHFSNITLFSILLARTLSGR